MGIGGKMLNQETVNKHCVMHASALNEFTAFTLYEQANKIMHA